MALHAEEGGEDGGNMKYWRKYNVWFGRVSNCRVKKYFAVNFADNQNYHRENK